MFIAIAASGDVGTGCPFVIAAASDPGTLVDMIGEAVPSGVVSGGTAEDILYACKTCREAAADSGIRRFTLQVRLLDDHFALGDIHTVHIQQV